MNTWWLTERAWKYKLNPSKIMQMLSLCSLLCLVLNLVWTLMGSMNLNYSLAWSIEWNNRRLCCWSLCQGKLSSLELRWCHMFGSSLLDFVFVLDGHVIGIISCPYFRWEMRHIQHLRTYTLSWLSSGRTNSGMLFFILLLECLSMMLFLIDRNIWGQGKGILNLNWGCLSW